MSETAQYPNAITTQLFNAVARLSTTLTADITSATTPIPVVSSTSFPTEGFMTIDNETIYYKGTSATNIGTTTCTRGYAGTAVAHLNGASVKYSIVAATINRIQAEIIATQTYAGTSGGTAGFVNARYLYGRTAGQYLWSGSTAADAKLLGGSTEGQLNVTYFGGSTKGEITGYVDNRVNTLLAVLTPAGAEIPLTDGAEKHQQDLTNSDPWVLSFDNANSENAYWRFKVPPTYQGGNVVVTIHFKTSVNTGAARLIITTIGIANGETYDTTLSSTIFDEIMTVPGTAGLLKIQSETYAGGMSPGWAVGDEAIIRLYRYASDANDTADADVDVTMVEIREV